MALLERKPASSSTLKNSVFQVGSTLKNSVFKDGGLKVKSLTVTQSPVSSILNPITIFTPNNGGTYPVLLFIHGFMCSATSYSLILKHVASHGFIIVAPQIYSTMFTSNTEEIQVAGAVTNWMATNLQPLLPSNVNADLKKLAVTGHSRGGKTAFCLAMGKAEETTLKYSALFGIDPVGGTEPKILKDIPRSFPIDIPVGIIGTGLGSQGKIMFMPACAPDGVNSDEFWNESSPPCSYFYAKDFGHMDMLDNGIGGELGRCMCKSGEKSCLKLMRKGTAGIVVAFMKAYLKGDNSDLLAIVDDPSLAPITFDPLIYIPE